MVGGGKPTFQFTKPTPGLLGSRQSTSVRHSQTVSESAAPHPQPVATLLAEISLRIGEELSRQY